VIIGVGRQTKVRNARRQQAIKKIGSGGGEDKASGHAPGQGTGRQPSLHSVEVSRAHPKALGTKVIGDRGEKTRLHCGARPLQGGARQGKARKVQAKAIPRVISPAPFLGGGVEP
jgi:hypothetical protein